MELCFQPSFRDNDTLIALDGTELYSYYVYKHYPNARKNFPNTPIIAMFVSDIENPVFLDDTKDCQENRYTIFNKEKGEFIFPKAVDEKIFIYYVRGTAIENGDEELSITSLGEAKDYILEYCDNLEFYSTNKFWSDLGDVPTNEDSEIDEDFLIWDKGVDCYDIWRWFEHYFDTQIGGNFI